MNVERSKVQSIRSQFENLSQAQDDILITAANKKQKPVFQRSRTSINLIGATSKVELLKNNILRNNNCNISSKLTRQTDDTKRASIKRSPAFRKTGEKTTKLQGPIKSNKKEFSHNFEDQILTETLKKALKQPLPTGPPPTKPKRTFETNIKELIHVEPANRVSPKKDKRSFSEKHAKTFKTDKNASTSALTVRKEIEPIYMDPCKDTNYKCLNHASSQDLHYMCTAVNDTHIHQEIVHDATTYDQINLLVGVAFSDVLHPPTPVEHATKLARSLTEKRKDYVRRTASKKNEYRTTIYSLYNVKRNNKHSDENEAICPIEPLKERLIKYKSLIDTNNCEKNKLERTTETKSIVRDKKQELFITCSLIGYDISKKNAYVKWTYPKNVCIPENLEELVFPSSKLVYQHNLSNQTYMQIITDLAGQHTYAFCRRIIPEGPNKILLPLAYCIVSDHLLPNFYYTILQEIECRHGQSEILVKNILQNLYLQKLPLPGEQLTCVEVKNSQSNRYNRRLSAKNYPNWLQSVNASDVNASDTVNFVIKRKSDQRLENTEINDLYKILGTEVLLHVFSTLLLERKVVLVSSSISSLSTCVIGLTRILFPFKWMYPIIVCLPDHLLDICDSPFPVLVGCLKQVNLQIENGLIIDLDAKEKVFQCCGDENTILPKELRKSLKMSLELVNLLDESETLASALISEAFLRFFVELLSNLNINEFNKHELIESQSNESVKLFLEWFVETSMFQYFLNSQKTSDEKLYYQTFFLKLQEKSLTINRSYHNLEALVKNCRIINKKSTAYCNRIKALFS